MKLSFPVLAAAGLVLIWGAMLLAIPFALNLFPDFRVESPATTAALLWVTHLLGGSALPALVLVTAGLLALRRFSAWLLALALCIAWNFAFITLASYIVALINSLAEGKGQLNLFNEAIPALEIPPQVYGMIVALLLNQVLFVWLLVKRRDFRR